MHIIFLIYKKIFENKEGIPARHSDGKVRSRMSKQASESEVFNN